MIIRLPRLLDADGREKCRLSPLQLSLRLKLTPLSTAEMLLPHDAPAIHVRDMLELYDENGSAGIFRVTEIQEDAGQTRLIRLEHGLATLKDSMLGTFAQTGAVKDVLTSLLAHQDAPRWEAGDVDLPEDTTIVYATAYISLLAALTLMMSMLPEGYALFFDQSEPVWKLHIRALSNEDACEGRLSRNLQSVQYTLDSSSLCTRIYPFGAEIDGQRVSLMPMDGRDYLQSGAAERWGVVSKTIASDLIFDASTLHDVAEAYLSLHAQPEATVTVNAIDLHQATGEPMDAFQLGKMCRICLPDLGLTLRQHISAITRPDVFGRPGQAVLTLRSRTIDAGRQTDIDDLVRQVTSCKLLGGTVSEVLDENRAYGTYASPIMHYFEIEDWASVLEIRVALQPDSGVTISDLLVDGTEVPANEFRKPSFSAMPYLRRNELGQIAPGQHYVTIHPTTGTPGESCGVSSSVTMTVIAKKTT